jgi:hypothetical protein
MTLIKNLGCHRPGPISLGGPGGGSPSISSGTRVFDFLVWLENFREVKKRKKMVSRAFLPGLFKGMRWELGNPSQFASFCTQAAAMTSPRSVEIKLGADEPLKPEEAKRCELKPPMEIKRTANIHCGRHVPTGAIASRFHVKEERVSTLVRRLERIWGMKRKDYKDVSPELKDYGGSDYSNDCSPSSWEVAEREDNDLY